MTINELREIFNLAPREDGDVIMQDLNHIDNSIANSYQLNNKEKTPNKEENITNDETKANPYHDKHGKFTTSGKTKLSKKEYGRLAHLIDSNPKKWEKGKTNSQIIDDKKYFFKYNGYNNFSVTGRTDVENE